MFASGSTVATVVYGQGGSFTSSTANLGGVSASSLSRPFGVAVDASGGVYTVDEGNNRALYFPSGVTSAATRVYGQVAESVSALESAQVASALSLSSTLSPMAAAYALPFSYSSSNSGGVNVYSLNVPRGGVCVDPTGGVYLSDSGNNRVLRYSGASTMASTVYGQGGSFSSAVVNSGGTVSASSMYYPSSVARDASGAVYVVDESNHRMLYFASGATTATRVWGQDGIFTTATCNNGGVGPNTLCYPYAVVLDSSGKPYIADYGHTHGHSDAAVLPHTCL